MVRTVLFSSRLPEGGRLAPRQRHLRATCRTKGRLRRAPPHPRSGGGARSCQLSSGREAFLPTATCTLVLAIFGPQALKRIPEENVRT
jgi:hypothetical protein